MLTESSLKELLDFSTAAEPVLSIYLNTEPSEGNADVYKLRLRTMLKKVNLAQDAGAVERFFNLEYDWTGRGVAVFSCAPEKFFRSYPLAVPVRDQISVGDRPALKPLADLLDNYGGYGVALVDKQGARLFYFHLGELREHEGMLGELVKRVKDGAASSVPGRRGGDGTRAHAIDETIERNMREIVDFSVHFFEENRVRRVLIGGTEDNVALFRSLMPKTWQSLVVGSFAMSMTASSAEVLARTFQVGREAERRREQKLIEQLVTTAAKGGGAVLGIEGVLGAASQGRTKHMLVVENRREPGYHCIACNWLGYKVQTACPMCGAKVEASEDVIDLAVAQVLRTGGDVEVVPPNPSMDRSQGIGAFLRY